MVNTTSNRKVSSTVKPYGSCGEKDLNKDITVHRRFRHSKEGEIVPNEDIMVHRRFGCSKDGENVLALDDSKRRQKSGRKSGKVVDKPSKKSSLINSSVSKCVAATKEPGKRTQTKEKKKLRKQTQSEEETVWDLSHRFGAGNILSGGSSQVKRNIMEIDDSADSCYIENDIDLIDNNNSISSEINGNPHTMFSVYNLLNF